MTHDDQENDTETIKTQGINISRKPNKTKVEQQNNNKNKIKFFLFEFRIKDLGSTKWNDLVEMLTSYKTNLCFKNTV